MGTINKPQPQSLTEVMGAVTVNMINIENCLNPISAEGVLRGPPSITSEFTGNIYFLRPTCKLIFLKDGIEYQLSQKKAQTCYIH